MSCNCYISNKFFLLFRMQINVIKNVCFIKKYVVDECWKLGHNIFSHFYFTYFFALLVFKLHCVNSANRQSVTICDNTIPYKIPQTVADKIYNKF